MPILIEDQDLFIKESGSQVTFQIQDGPIREVGVNGCQIDHVILWTKKWLEQVNDKFPCRENSMAITKLDETLLWLLKRTLDREARKVEGLNKL